MGRSVNGQICYGVLLGVDANLPWDNAEYDGDIEDWWLRGVLGFRHSFNIFTPEGDWIGFKRPAEGLIDAYFEEKSAFKKTHLPVPIEVVNAGSGSAPTWILAIPESVVTSDWGDPEIFSPANLKVSDEEVDSLLDFCNKYGIVFVEGPNWWLSAYSD